MRNLTLAALTALMLTGAGVAQSTAAVISYGFACRNYNNTVNAPVMQVSGLPQPGAPVTLRYLGPNSVPYTQPVLITGLSSANVPVPRLTLQMATNCTLLVNPDIAVYFMPLGTVGFLDRITYTVPNTPAVIGASVYHQWATVALSALDPQAPALNYLLFSNAVQVRAGF